MPNRPMTAIRKWKPVSSVSVPKVRRKPPVTSSVPTQAKAKPSIIARDDLERRLPAHADEGAEGQQIDREVFRRPEIEREVGDDRRHESQHDRREKGADEGRRQRGGERLAGAALLGERMAVEGGRHRPWLARNVEQDGADAAAEQRAPIDRRQHDDGGGVVHREGERQQDGDAVGAADAGQEAEQHAEQDADHHVPQVHGRQQHLETVHQRKERVQLEDLPVTLSGSRARPLIVMPPRPCVAPQ